MKGNSHVSQAVCVLGCRSGSAALLRRATTAAGVYRAGRATLVVACGGRAWDGVLEADDLARMLVDAGVPEAAIVRETRSVDTHENATGANALLVERGIRDVVVVTCSWHVPRATMLFGRAGLNVIAGVGAPQPDATLLDRLYWRARERVSLWKDLHR